jgi:ergothioneine biosynthesis protein EgtB
MKLIDHYKTVRNASEAICRPLQKEDYVVQPVVDVSPPKWHLGHTTWFWEAFVLTQYKRDYTVFNTEYNYVFNSYYETIGARVIRTDRGNLSRPSVDEIYQYRKHVDRAMTDLIGSGPDPALEDLIVLGLNHEQQHQELLFTDIKYILGHNPLFPAWGDKDIGECANEGRGNRKSDKTMITMQAGNYVIGHEGNGFCFDNELGRHQVWLDGYLISAELVTNEEYLLFMESGGYSNFVYWHAEGWDWVRNHQVKSPMYWHRIDGVWKQYTLGGLRVLEPGAAVCHISYYEAAAYAAWKGMRLPREEEWEAAAERFKWGSRWEWTESAYLPYPGFRKAAGAIGEYNGKFMVNQMVLRGASVATPTDHSRQTYRNFFHPHLRWQFMGVRLAANL